MTESEQLEELRLERVKEFEADAKEFGRTDVDIGPGSYSFHEVLHCAFLAHENIENNLLEHPSVFHNKDLYERATKISQALWDFYQECGRLHLTDDKKE